MLFTLGLTVALLLWQSARGFCGRRLQLGRITADAVIAGEEAWVPKAAIRLGLEITFRPRGRPKKAKKTSETAPGTFCTSWLTGVESLELALQSADLLLALVNRSGGSRKTLPPAIDDGLDSARSTLAWIC